MESHGASQEEFGKDLGLVHEAVITGRKVGAGKEFWARLAHSEDLFRQVMAAVMPPAVESEPEPQPGEIAEQARFWREVFGIELDLMGVAIPEKRRGFNWFVVVPEGMTPNRAFEKCKERFPSWRYTEDLDEVVRGRDEREATKAYAARFRDRVEADKELKSKSANDLRGEGIPGITLLERLILELWYHWKTGGHLDRECWTLCSGSRDAGGYVPCVGWYGEGLGVDWANPATRGDFLRSRQPVSS